MLYRSIGAHTYSAHPKDTGTGRYRYHRGIVRNAVVCAHGRICLTVCETNSPYCASERMLIHVDIIAKFCGRKGYHTRAGLLRYSAKSSSERAERASHAWRKKRAAWADDKSWTLATKSVASGSSSAKLCKCGSSTHSRTSHRDCPLNKKK